MKRIFIPFFATAALLASCSDWTEVEHRDLLPQMNQSDPVFLASLRDFKAGEHLVTMMIVRGTSTAPNRQNQHPMSMPDSVDYLLMTDVDNLHPALMDEIAEVRSKKGTRTLNVVDYTTIRSAWVAMKEESSGTEHEGDFTEDKFAEYCKIETEKQLAACSRYGFDGIVVSYLGGYDSSVAAPFVLAADTWRRDNPDKLLFFRGYPAFITSIENQTILSECDYVIILTEGASSSVAISRMVRDQLEEGVPSNRVVLEASVPSIADGGDDAQVGASLQVAAQWVMDPKTSQTAEYRAHLVCPVHVHICAQKRLYRVNDNQLCVVFPDCPCDAFIGKGQWCVSIVNDKHFFKVCVCFHQSGLDRITQTVLGSLVNDIERFKGFHTGQGLSVGASRRKTHGKVGLALAGVALYNRQLSKGDIGKP